MNLASEFQRLFDMPIDPFLDGRREFSIGALEEYLGYPLPSAKAEVQKRWGREAADLIYRLIDAGQVSVFVPEEPSLQEEAA